MKRGLQAGDPAGPADDRLLHEPSRREERASTASRRTARPAAAGGRLPGARAGPASLSIYGVADFLDIHAYPNASPWNAAFDLDTIERGLFKRPYIVGELGALKSVYGGDIARAAYGMRDAQVATCKLGAQGWLYWTWDTHENLASQPLFFHLDESGGAINGQLAPVARPDPCRAG